MATPNALQAISRLDSPELAAARRQELDLPRHVAAALGRSAVEADSTGQCTTAVALPLFSSTRMSRAGISASGCTSRSGADKIGTSVDFRDAVLRSSARHLCTTFAFRLYILAIAAADPFALRVLLVVLETAFGILKRTKGGGSLFHLHQRSSRSSVMSFRRCRGARDALARDGPR